MAAMLDLAIPLVGKTPGTVRHSGSTAPMKGRQRRSASHVDDRGCVDADAAEALAGTNVIEAADLTQNAGNDVVDTLADTTVFPTVFTDRTPSTCPRCLGQPAAPRHPRGRARRG